MTPDSLTIRPQRYVYDNVEVVKTGRTAVKKLRSGTMDELFEITPIESIDGTWKKWVRLSELFEINT